MEIEREEPRWSQTEVELMEVEIQAETKIWGDTEGLEDQGVTAGSRDVKSPSFI